MSNDEIIKAYSDTVKSLTEVIKAQNEIIEALEKESTEKVLE